MSLVLVLWAKSAHAEDAPPPPVTLTMPTGHLHLGSGEGVLRAPDGRLFAIPKGSHVYDEPTWAKVDAELRRLQDAETHLTAENKSLRATADGWTPGWRTLLGAVVVGVAGGVYLHAKL